MKFLKTVFWARKYFIRSGSENPIKEKSFIVDKNCMTPKVKSNYAIFKKINFSNDSADFE